MKLTDYDFKILVIHDHEPLVESLCVQVKRAQRRLCRKGLLTEVKHRGRVAYILADPPAKGDAP